MKVAFSIKNRSIKEENMKKVAVVTGAAAGIGQCIALELAKSGYEVYANARSLKKLEDTLKKAENLNMKPLIFDVRDLSSVKENICSIDRIDCLVNNAGLSIENKPICDITEDDWDSIMQTNVKGYFFVTKYALARMQRGAAIVNMSSGAAKTGGDFVSIPYSSSKGAINSLTVAMARVLAKDGIRLNAVSPGFVDTAMLELNKKPKDYYDGIIPLGKLGRPIDIANMVLYLLSDKADFMTGQIIEVNGGDIMG